MVDTKLLKAIFKGLLTFIPGISSFVKKQRKRSTHSSSDAEFCYALWLSILVFCDENGIKPKFEKIGEIGNGGSFGVGICALLSGSSEYFALNIEDVFDKEQNLKMLDDIILLFKKRTSIPNKFKVLNINISNYEYPVNLIKPFFLQDVVVSEIRKDILNGFINSNRIKNIMNWNLADSLTLDFVFSRAVMEHVYNPNLVYKGLTCHLNQNAYMLHDIEFHSHGITEKINGHYLISNLIWYVIFGKRDFLLNRWSLEKHLFSMIENGFEIIKTHKSIITNKKFKEEVLNGAVILAKKLNK